MSAMPLFSFYQRTRSSRDTEHASCLETHPAGVNRDGNDGRRARRKKAEQVLLDRFA